MRANSKITFDNVINYLQVLHVDKLALCDAAHTFGIYDLHSLQRKHSFTFKEACISLEKRCISFSPDGKYIAFSEEKQSVVRVIDIQKQSLHHSFPTASNQIETLCFDPTSNYLVAGSVTGRVFLWNLFSTGQVSRLSSFPEYSPNMLLQSKINYVSAIAFSPNTKHVATTGYGGSIVITNIHTEVLPKRLTPKHIRINALHFINEKLLCAGNIEGGIDIIDTHETKIIKHFQTGLGNITKLVSSSCESYLFASGLGRQVLLINLKTLKVIQNEYITLDSKITNLCLTNEDTMLISCEDKTLYTYELYPQDKLQLHLETGAYQKAYSLIQEYPLLQDSPLVNELEDIWQEHLSQAIIKVETRHFDEVEPMLKKFSNISSKKEIIQGFHDLISHFEHFKLSITQKNYALAYSMAERVPLLKRTSLYLEMEALWSQAFLKAQAYIIKDNTHLLFKTLEPYAKVSTKLCFIQVLLHQPKLFLNFTQHINQHLYEKIFAIAHQYPCLKEIESFQNVVITIKDLEKKCHEHILSGDYALAQLEIEEISPIPYMKNQLKHLSNFLTLAVHFDELYREKRFNEAYSLLDKHEILHALKNAQILEKEWSEKIKEGEKEALLGHTKKLKSILGGLITLASRSQKVGMLLRQSYLTQIKFLLIKKKTTLVSPAIHNYIKIFSYDSELDNLLTKIKKDKLAVITLSEDEKLRQPRHLWLSLSRGNLPDTILHEREMHA